MRTLCSSHPIMKWTRGFGGMDITVCFIIWVLHSRLEDWNCRYDASEAADFFQLSTYVLTLACTHAEFNREIIFTWML